MIPTYIEYLRRQQKALRDELSRVGDLLAQLSKQGATTQTQAVAAAHQSSTLIVVPESMERPGPEAAK
jgi:hypothetical protein